MNIWADTFGDDYTQRQARTVNYRAPILYQLIPPDVQSILEIGANAGQNIEALRDGPWELSATEPNRVARAELRRLCPVTPDWAHKLSHATGSVDLVMTVGVLIHVPRDKLQASMAEMHRVTRKYILIGEYFDDKERMIEYRGQPDQLWRHDYGGLFVDAFKDLHFMINPVFCYKRTTNLDNLTFWLLEKGPKAH